VAAAIFQGFPDRDDAWHGAFPTEMTIKTIMTKRVLFSAARCYFYYEVFIVRNFLINM